MQAIHEDLEFVLILASLIDLLPPFDVALPARQPWEGKKEAKHILGGLGYLQG